MTSIDCSFLQEKKVTEITSPPATLSLMCIVFETTEMLPVQYHPIYNWDGFEAASSSCFIFLSNEAFNDSISVTWLNSITSIYREVNFEIQIDLFISISLSDYMCSTTVKNFYLPKFANNIIIMIRSKKY
jgi:hypothetical protein